jgi:hypothetical protein
VAAGVPRWEGARGAEVRKGGEWRAPGGEEEMGARFIRVGRGDGRPSSGRRCVIKAPVTRRGDDGVATIHGEIEEESVVHRFSSIRVRKGVHRRRAEWQRQPRTAAWSSIRGRRRPGWVGVGPSALAQRAMGPVSVGDKKNGGGPHEGMGRNQRIKKNGLFKWFRIYLRFRIQKLKETKYF